MKTKIIIIYMVLITYDTVYVILGKLNLSNSNNWV